MCDHETEKSEAKIDTPASQNKESLNIPQTEKRETNGAKEGNPTQHRGPVMTEGRFFFYSLLFDAMLFIATSVYAYFAYQQVVALNESISQSQRLAVYARIQAASSKKAADASDKSAQAAMNSSNIAESALLANRKWAEISNQPYITVEAVKLTKALAINDKINIDFLVRNSGKTPALGAYPFMSVGIFDRAKDIERFPPRIMTEQVGVTPETPRHVFFTTDGVLPRNTFDIIMKGGQTIYVYGRTGYESAFGRQYDGRPFCYSTIPILSASL
jgi:hypothetical protein